MRCVYKRYIIQTITSNYFINRPSVKWRSHEFKPVIEAGKFDLNSVNRQTDDTLRKLGSINLFSARGEFMKIAKYLLGFALGSLAALSAHAGDNWSVGVAIGNPYPPAYYAPPPVYYAPPPVVVYPHPQSRFYGVPAVAYPAPTPGFIQFSYGNGGYNYAPGGYYGGGGWGHGHGHHHHHHR